MNHKGSYGRSGRLSLLDSFDDTGNFHIVCKRPGNDFTGEQIHDAGQVDITGPIGPDIGVVLCHDLAQNKMRDFPR